MRLDRHAEAIEEYRRTLQGLYEHDPNLMLGLARAQFGARQPAEARATLDALIQHNPEFRSADGHLLYARALETGRPAPARAGGIQGAGRLLPRRRSHRALRAAAAHSRASRRPPPKHCAACWQQAAVAPAHYRRTQEEWLKQAERELAAL